MKGRVSSNPRIPLLAWVFLLASSHILKAQPTGMLKGRCVTAVGAPAGGVGVRILNSSHTTTTDSSGRFLMTSVAPGRHMLSFSSPLHGEMLRGVIVKTDSVTDLAEIVLADPTKSLSEVLVIAEKREETDFRTPVAVTSLSARKAEAYRLWDLSQLTSIVPNLYTSEPGDGRNLTGIRGIATTSYDPAVATYIDGVIQFSLDSHIPLLTDVERMEVLRGPQGTLFGRNAMGGVILVTTRKPTNLATAFAEFNTGDYGLHRHMAGFRTPLVRDRLFFGSTILFNRRKGYHVNEFDGNDFDRLRQFYGSHNLVWTPSPKISVSLDVKHLEGRNEGAFPLAPDVETAFRKPYRLSQDAASKMRDRTLNASLTAKWEHPSFRLTSSTAFQKNHRFYAPPIDGDFSPLDIVTIDNDFGNELNLNRVWTQELRLQNPSGKEGSWIWTAGAFLFAQYNPARQAVRFGTEAALIGVTGAPFSLTSENIAKGSGLAFFGQATRRIQERWWVTAGLRQDFEGRRLYVGSEFEAPGISATVTRPDTSGRKTFSALSPKIGVRYQIDGRHSLYLSYSRGFRAGGLTTLGSDPSSPPLSPFGPEYSDNIEAGWKAQGKNGRWRMGLYAFLTRVGGVQTPTLILPDAVTVTRNTGDLRSKGFELEMDAIPIHGLEVGVTAGLTDARYERLLLSVDGEEKDLRGNRQVFTPSHTTMTVVQYNLPTGVKESARWQARIEWRLTGKTHFDLQNQIWQDTHSLFNTRFGWQDSRMGIHIWIRNLAGRRYIDYAYPFGAVHLGNPRTWGVTFSIRR